MSQNLRSAFKELVAALIGVLNAATADSRTHAKALHQRVLIAMSRILARWAGMSHAEVLTRFPERRATAEVSNAAEVIQLHPVEERKPRRPAERRDSSMFDVTSIVPPNLERAVTSQMRASHKSRLTHEELMRFLSAFGVPRGDARGALTVTKARTRRDYVTADDMQDIQAWIGKGWIDSRKKSHGSALEDVLRRQLQIASNVELAAETIANVLVARGYGVGTANDIAAKLAMTRAAGRTA